MQSKIEVPNRLVEYYRESKIPLRLSCSTLSGWPVVLSLWYLYEDGHLYCATRKGARIIAYLKNDPRCAFEVAGDLPPYCGVRGQAVAVIDEQRGVEILECLIIRYLGDKNNPLARGLLRHKDEEVAIQLNIKRIFTWDFTERMKESISQKNEKVCP